MKAPMMKKLPMPAAKKPGGKPAMPGIEIEIGEEEEPEEAAGGEAEAMDLKSLMGGEEEGAEEGEAEDLSHLSDEALMAEVRKRKLAMGGAAEKPAPEMPE